MTDGDQNDNRQDSTSVDDGGNEYSSLATQLAIPIIEDSNPNDQRRDSTSLDIPDSEGLRSLISSVMTGFDLKAGATARSQDQLAFSVDRLIGELDKLLEDAPSPFIMQYSARISGLRKRVKALNTVLKSILRQTDNMDRMMSAGIVQETLVGESIGQQPSL